MPADDGDAKHLICDARDILNDGWDLMVGHPPCTFLTTAGLHHCRTDPARKAKMLDAVDFVKQLWAAPIPRVCIENPPGALSRRFGLPAQTIQVCHFGEPYLKRYCFWLRGLLPLQPTDRVDPSGDRVTVLF